MAQNKAKKTDEEQVLQAVILADSFEDRFAPFSLQKPRCLLPLANVPLIEYTLRFLQFNGVDEVYIYAHNHVDQLEEYIDKSPLWSFKSKLNPFRLIEFLRVTNATSVGDCLRDLDKRGIVHGDFVLVHGDVVANLDLQPVLEQHKARREANRDACMTIVLREAGLGPHRAKPKAVTPVFLVEKPGGRCLHYGEVSPADDESCQLLDEAVLKFSHTELRADLIDPGIDICTPDVLALWSESYDFSTPRKHFLQSVLNDWELNGKMIYTHVVDEGYAARASNLQMYDAVSRDVVGRFTFPFVPDRDASYKRLQNGVYLEQPVTLSPRCELASSVVGRGTSFGNGSQVSRSVIGQNCTIGKNVRIEKSFIWDDVVIGDNTVLTHAVVASSVKVGSNCQVPEGCLVSFGVHIGDDITLPRNAAVSVLDHAGKPSPNDTKLLGAQGRGASYAPEDEDDERDPASLEKTLIFSVEHLDLSDDSVSSFGDSDPESDSDDDTTAGPARLTRSRLSSVGSEDSETARKTASFHTDAVHGLLDALRDAGGDFDAAKLEFMGLRLSLDASDAAVRRAVAAALALRASELLNPAAGRPALAPGAAAERAVKGTPGAAAFVREMGIDRDPVPFVLALQKALLVARADKAGALLQALLQQLWHSDALDGDDVVAWWDDPRSSEGEAMAAVRGRCQELMTFLEDAEDDDSDEDDEDEDEDDA